MQQMQVDMKEHDGDVLIHLHHEGRDLQIIVQQGKVIVDENGRDAFCRFVPKTANNFWNWLTSSQQGTATDRLQPASFQQLQGHGAVNGG